MVELLIGKKGTGKTKSLIEKVNNALTVAKGNVVFISNDTNRNIFDVTHQSLKLSHMMNSLDLSAVL